MSDVQTDATQPKAYHDPMDAAEAILDRWTDADEQPSEGEQLEATDETLEEETIEDDSETTEDEQD